MSTHQVAAQLITLWRRSLSDTTRLWELLDELKIGLTDMKLLHTLSRGDTPPTVKDLARAMGLSLPGASRAADALLRRGWVERSEDADDRRMKRLAITPAGAAVAERIDEARMGDLEALLRDVDPADLERLGEAITPIVEQLEGRTA